MSYGEQRNYESSTDIPMAGESLYYGYGWFQCANPTLKNFFPTFCLSLYILGFVGYMFYYYINMDHQSFGTRLYNDKTTSTLIIH